MSKLIQKCSKCNKIHEDGDCKLNKKSQKNPLSHQKGSVKERQVKALEYRIQGKSYDEIAEILGYKSSNAVYKLVQKALDAVVKEKASELITMSNIQLEKLTEAWNDRAMDDPKALKCVLEIFDRRTKLLNLVTDKQEITHKIEKVDIKFDD